ncbi:MAG TPA: RNA polymerase sigma factor [Ktedonobacterales bacterium]|nr:RNA polymerase sigma factor [Ktedonobacterales bacterium]
MANDHVSRGEVATGERFEAFFHTHDTAIFGYLWRMTGNREVASDLTQETFVRAWQRFSTISTYDAPRSWLFRVATHLALNYARHSRTRATVDSWAAVEPAYDNPAHADHADQIVDRDAICMILLSLPPRERAALILHSVYGYSFAEVAQALSISLSAARVALWRGREHFRARYLREEGQP